MQQHIILAYNQLMWTTKVVCAFTDQLYSTLEDVYMEYIFNLTKENITITIIIKRESIALLKNTLLLSMENTPNIMSCLLAWVQTV